MATYWEKRCSFGLRYVSWYKCLIVSLVFSHLGFWSGNLFLIAPFPDLCLHVPFYTEAKQIFGEASMNLRDWMSNEESVMQEIPNEDRANEGPMKILGLTWIPESDLIALLLYY